MLGEVHVLPCFCDGLNEPLHFRDAVERSVGFHARGKQLSDGIPVELSEIHRDVPPALIVQATLQTDQNSTGFTQSFSNLILIVVLMVNFNTG